MLQQGGKVIGEGGFGCVHEPALKCETNPPNLLQIEKQISKTIQTTKATDEIKEYETIASIDPENLFHLGTPETCQIDPNNLNNKRELRSCYHLTRNDPNLTNNLRNYSLIIMENGGENLSDFAKRINNNYVIRRNFTEGQQVMTDFWQEAYRLFVGLQKFYNTENVHYDLKAQNAVYNQSNKRINFIDFGLMKNRPDVLNIARTSYNPNWNIPLEYNYINDKRYREIQHFVLSCRGRVQELKNITYTWARSHINDQLRSVVQETTTYYNNFLYSGGRDKEISYELANTFLYYFDPYYPKKDEFTRKCIDTIDSYGLGLSLLTVLKFTYSLIDIQFATELRNLFLRMSTMDLKNRYTIDIAMKTYGDILRKYRLAPVEVLTVAERREEQRLENERKEAELRENERKEAERREIERKEAERREIERKEAEEKYARQLEQEKQRRLQQEQEELRRKQQEIERQEQITREKKAQIDAQVKRIIEEHRIRQKKREAEERRKVEEQKALEEKKQEEIEKAQALRLKKEKEESDIKEAIEKSKKEAKQENQRELTEILQKHLKKIEADKKQQQELLEKQKQLEEARQFKEQARLNNESIRIEAEKLRFLAEQARIEAEKSEIEAEKTRLIEEKVRLETEQERIMAEQEQIKNLKSENELANQLKQNLIEKENIERKLMEKLGAQDFEIQMLKRQMQQEKTKMEKKQLELENLQNLQKDDNNETIIGDLLKEIEKYKKDQEEKDKKFKQLETSPDPTLNLSENEEVKILFESLSVIEDVIDRNIGEINPTFSEEYVSDLTLPIIESDEIDISEIIPPSAPSEPIVFDFSNFDFSELEVEKGAIAFLQTDECFYIVPSCLNGLTVFYESDFEYIDTYLDLDMRNDRLRRGVRENPIIARELGENYSMFKDEKEVEDIDIESKRIFQLGGIPLSPLKDNMQLFMVDLYEYFSNNCNEAEIDYEYDWEGEEDYEEIVKPPIEITSDSADFVIDLLENIQESSPSEFDGLLQVLSDIFDNAPLEEVYIAPPKSKKSVRFDESKLEEELKELEKIKKELKEEKARELEAEKARLAAEEKARLDEEEKARLKEARELKAKKLQEEAEDEETIANIKKHRLEWQNKEQKARELKAKKLQEEAEQARKLQEQKDKELAEEQARELAAIQSKIAEQKTRLAEAVEQARIKAEAAEVEQARIKAEEIEQARLAAAVEQSKKLQEEQDKLAAEKEKEEFAAAQAKTANIKKHLEEKKAKKKELEEQKRIQDQATADAKSKKEEARLKEEERLAKLERQRLEEQKRIQDQAAELEIERQNKEKAAALEKQQKEATELARKKQEEADELERQRLEKENQADDDPFVEDDSNEEYKPTDADEEAVRTLTNVDQKLDFLKKLKELYESSISEIDEFFTDNGSSLIEKYKKLKELYDKTNFNINIITKFIVPPTNEEIINLGESITNDTIPQFKTKFEELKRKKEQIKFNEKKRLLKEKLDKYANSIDLDLLEEWKRTQPDLLKEYEALKNDPYYLNFESKELILKIDKTLVDQYEFIDGIFKKMNNVVIFEESINTIKKEYDDGENGFAALIKKYKNATAHTMNTTAFIPNMLKMFKSYNKFIKSKKYYEEHKSEFSSVFTELIKEAEIEIKIESMKGVIDKLLKSKKSIITKNIIGDNITLGNYIRNDDSIIMDPQEKTGLSAINTTMFKDTNGKNNFGNRNFESINDNDQKAFFKLVHFFLDDSVTPGPVAPRKKPVKKGGFSTQKTHNIKRNITQKSNKKRASQRVFRRLKKNISRKMLS